MVQMPALNTPQFDWVKSRLAHKAQPVPLICEPEVAAEAIYWAAHSHRREVQIGFSTMVAITANKFAPGVLDRYLGKTGYESQQYDGLDNPNRQNNLWEPLAGDHGAHGDFDARSKDRSVQFWLDRHKAFLLFSALGLGVLWLSGKLWR